MADALVSCEQNLGGESSLGLHEGAFANVSPHRRNVATLLRLRYDLATICPPFVLGPIIHQADSAETLNTCMRNQGRGPVILADAQPLRRGTRISRDKRPTTRQSSPLVSSATSAMSPGLMSRLCSCQKLEESASGSQRVSQGFEHPLIAGTFTHQLLLDHVRSQPEMVQAFPKATQGKPGTEVPKQNWFDCSRSEKMLGLKPTPERDTA